MTFQTKQVREHGGLHGIRDRALLESAVARPQFLFHYRSNSLTIFDLGASYAYGIIKNHPFIDGNKRTAMVSAGVFLRINNCFLEVAEVELVQNAISLANGALSEKEFSFWLRLNCKKV